MSRSRRKTPISGVTGAASDRRFKKSEHSRERAAVRDALVHGEDPPPTHAFGDPWKSEKDGKQFVPHRPDLMRK